LRRFLRIALPLFVLLGAVYAWVVPPGEAPDEPAHLAYIDHIAEKGALPPARPSRDLTGYESYQPPLDYLVSAALLRGLHGGPIAYPFVANPDFDFRISGSRAFLAQPGAESQARALRRLRVARLFWGVLTIWLVFQVANILVDREWAVAAVAPFCLAPQFLFDTATINNDTAVIAFASATIYGLCRLVSRPPGFLSGLLTGGAAGLALWSKSSGLFLVPPLLYVAMVLWRRRQRRAVAGLFFAFAVLSTAWIVFTVARSGPLLVSAQTESAAASGWLRLITEPAWPASVWISFWGKLGWLNLKLPAPIYLFFLPPTFLALWGGISALRQRSAAITVALLAVLSNLGLFVAYLGGVDWQLQGRYLFPSIAALAGLAAKGLGDLGGKLGFRPSVTVSFVFVYAAVAAFGAWWIVQAYVR
jgi:hypothetical protein